MDFCFLNAFKPSTTIKRQSKISSSSPSPSTQLSHLTSSMAFLRIRAWHQRQPQGKKQSTAMQRLENGSARESGLANIRALSTTFPLPTPFQIYLNFGI